MHNINFLLHETYLQLSLFSVPVLPHRHFTCFLICLLLVTTTPLNYRALMTVTGWVDLDGIEFARRDDMMEER
ncbi:unnamed protein product [Litomosoides sigmodontis]|uniref:Uncharacterized protein n=1 Tax=Litomosoides sigmodontis TaxID=42156 RepID=A0A3P6SB46_LITSI|nr:unnamed protein product [Litomosoides sigmodontis]